VARGSAVVELMLDGRITDATHQETHRELGSWYRWFVAKPGYGRQRAGLPYFLEVVALLPGTTGIPLDEGVCSIRKLATFLWY
jgi:hypothetical protein